MMSDTSNAKTRNCVFIASSLDGYIADKDGGIAWLHAIPNPGQNDMGYGRFVAQMDAIVMGRNTFETVWGFGIEWPYKIPVFVLSNSMKELPAGCGENVSIVNGSLPKIIASLNDQGFYQLYIDGGKVIQSFLEEDLIDELTITLIPKLLGGGTRLFSTLTSPLDFACIESTIYLDKVVQNRFVRAIE